MASPWFTYLTLALGVVSFMLTAAQLVVSLDYMRCRFRQLLRLKKNDPLENLRIETNNQQQQITDLQGEKEKLQKDLMDVTTQRDNLQQAHDAIKERVEGQQASLTSQKKVLRALNVTISELNGQVRSNEEWKKRERETEERWKEKEGKVRDEWKTREIETEERCKEREEKIREECKREKRETQERCKEREEKIWEEWKKRETETEERWKEREERGWKEWRKREREIDKDRRWWAKELTRATRGPAERRRHLIPFNKGV